MLVPEVVEEVLVPEMAAEALVPEMVEEVMVQQGPAEVLDPELAAAEVKAPALDREEEVKVQVLDQEAAEVNRACTA